MSAQHVLDLVHSILNHVEAAKNHAVKIIRYELADMDGYSVNEIEEVKIVLSHILKGEYQVEITKPDYDPEWSEDLLCQFVITKI